MIAAFVTYIESVLIPLGAWGVFLGSLLEQIIAPIPSAVVQLSGGFFLIEEAPMPEPILNIFLKVALPSGVAIIIASTAIYFIAFSFGKPFISAWGKWFGFSWKDVLWLQGKFRKTWIDDVLIFVFRTLPIAPTIAVDVFCGLIRYDIKKYLILTFVGTLIRASILGFIGYQAGNLYTVYTEKIGLFEDYILIALVIGVLGALWYRWYTYGAKKHE